MKKLLIILPAILLFSCKQAEPQIIVKTKIIYRDTCDSKFIHAIGELETLNNDSLVGDGGRAFGRYQIHSCAVTGSGLEKALGYQHKDMKDSVKAEHVFWAIMGINSYVYAQKYGQYPSYEDLARMWNGGPNGYKMEATLNYLKKFRQCQGKN